MEGFPSSTIAEKYLYVYEIMKGLLELRTVPFRHE